MKHLLFLLCLGSAAAWQRTQCGPGDQVTEWGRKIDPNNILPEYPRPQLVRSGPWKNLNGIWEFQPAQQGQTPPFGHTLNETILVPFPVESCLSGVGKNYKFLFYRHVLDSPFPFPLTGRAILRFGAVDWQTDVYVNGQKVGNHTGGYDGFEFDVTAQLRATGNEIFVYVYDPSDEGFQPNGKQRISAIQNPDGDTYTPSSGIWQTVWLELVPSQFVSDIKILTPDLQSAKITVNTADGAAQPVTIDILDGLTVVASASSTTGTETSIHIPNAKTWGPESPFLYNVNIRIQSGDHVTSYLGVRTVALAQVQYPGRPATGPQPGIDRPGNDMPGSPFRLPSADPDLCWARCNATAGCEAWAYAVPGCDQYADPMCWLKSSAPGTTNAKCRVSGAQGTPPGLVSRPTLNGKFIFMAGWLDQSWWPDGLYTAPTDEALAFDVKAVKQFGLNTIRLHQKVNSERWYWYADTEGIIVLQDMIQKYGGATQATVAPFAVDLKAMIKGRYNHPSIIQWDVFNEGDCVAQFKPQEFVDLVRQLDPTRLVDTNSGGPANDLRIADVNDVHTYPWPGNPRPSKTQYAMVGEYGGVGAFVAGKEWVPGKCQTYLHVDTPQDEADTYVQMAKQILDNKDDISVSIYTQITDVERECDGFLNFDRTNKFNSTQMQAIVAANQKLING